MHEYGRLTAEEEEEAKVAWQDRATGGRPGIEAIVRQDLDRLKRVQALPREAQSANDSEECEPNYNK